MIRDGKLQNKLSQCLLAPDLGDKNKCLNAQIVSSGGYLSTYIFEIRSHNLNEVVVFENKSFHAWI